MSDAIRALGLSDERPLDIQARKDALNAFLAGKLT